MGIFMSQFTIIHANTHEDIASIRKLFTAYADWLVGELNIDLGYQDFSKELASLPAKYALPNGILLIAKNYLQDAIGCIALKSLVDKEICEVKRLYLSPQARGIGLGKSLISEVLSYAKSQNYEKAFLDTQPSMKSAIHLYKSFGFKEIPAYYDTPIKETIFLGLDL